MYDFFKWIYIAYSCRPVTEQRLARLQWQVRETTRLFEKSKILCLSLVSLLLVLYPLDLIKRRLMVEGFCHFPLEKAIVFLTNGFSGHGGADVKGYRNGLHAFTVVLREEGIRGLYKGVPRAVLTALRPFFSGARHRAKLFKSCANRESDMAVVRDHEKMVGPGCETNQASTPGVSARCCRFGQRKKIKIKGFFF